MQTKNLVTPKELAEILKVPVSWVYQRRCRENQGFPHLKVGKYLRFNVEEVMNFLKLEDK